MKTELYHWAGSTQLVTGLIASFYILILQMRKGTSKFFILPTSDNLVTITIGLAFIATSYNLENNRTCHYITILDLALILTPLINAFMSIVAYVLQNCDERNYPFQKKTQNYIKYTASLSFQWGIPILVCVTIYLNSNEAKQFKINNNCTSCEPFNSENETIHCCSLIHQNYFDDREFDFTPWNHSFSIKSIEDEQNKLTTTIIEKIYRLVKESMESENETEIFNAMMPALLFTNKISLRQNNTSNNSAEESGKDEVPMEILTTTTTTTTTTTEISEVLTTPQNMLSSSETNYENDEDSTVLDTELNSDSSPTYEDIAPPDMPSTSPQTGENSHEIISTETSENFSDEETQEFQEHVTRPSQTMIFHNKTQFGSNNSTEPYALHEQCRACHKSYTFIRVCFLVVLFFCCCIPVALGMTMYITVKRKIVSTSEIHRLQDGEHVSQSNQKNIHILKATNKMLYFLLIASILFWSPQLVNIFLNFWLCFHLPTWMKVLLFFVSQLFEIVRCVVNIQYLHFLTKPEQNAGLLGKKQAEVSPKQETEDHSKQFFEKVNDPSRVLEVQSVNGDNDHSNNGK